MIVCADRQLRCLAQIFQVQKRVCRLAVCDRVIQRADVWSCLGQPCLNRCGPGRSYCRAEAGPPSSGWPGRHYGFCGHVWAGHLLRAGQWLACEAHACWRYADRYDCCGHHRLGHRRYRLCLALGRMARRGLCRICWRGPLGGGRIVVADLVCAWDVNFERGLAPYDTSCRKRPYGSCAPGGGGRCRAR